MTQISKGRSKQRRKTSKFTEVSQRSKTNPGAQAAGRHPGEQSQSRRHHSPDAAQNNRKHAATSHGALSAAQEQKLKRKVTRAPSQENAAQPKHQDRPMARNEHRQKQAPNPQLSRQPGVHGNESHAVVAAQHLKEHITVEMTAQPGDRGTALPVQGLHLATESIALGAMWMRAALAWSRMGVTAARQMWGAADYRALRKHPSYG